MRRLPYDDYRRNSLVLRDWLAMDRTLFASSRTLNDYLKTFITAVLATLVFLAIFKGCVWETVMYIGFVFAGMVLVAGIILIGQAYGHHRRLHYGHPEDRHE